MDLFDTFLSGAFGLQEMQDLQNKVQKNEGLGPEAV